VTRFQPKRATAKYCSATCRQRAARQRKAAEAEAESEKTAGSSKEHGLVKAVRKELVQAKALDTVAGQLALAAARRIANPEESGFAAMSKELRSLLAEAKDAPVPIGDPPPDRSPAPEPDDQVAEARRARDRKRAALGEEDAGRA